MKLTFQEVKAVMKEEFPELNCCELQEHTSSFYNDIEEEIKNLEETNE
jgi:hypothetical protein